MYDYGKENVIKKAIDMTGYKTGLITVLERAGSAQGQSTWLCKCACGKTFIQYGGILRKGSVKSCGHLRNSKIERQKIAYKTIAKTKHGASCDRLYFMWASMKGRCYTKSNPSYHNYGGRGIVVCNEWKNDFSAFRQWAIENGYDENAPRGECTLDRIDNNGNYEPSNCRWITMLEQCKNRRRAVLITYNGETHSTKEWANITGLPQHTIYERYRYGWEPAEIFTPIDQHRKRNPKHHKISSTQNAG